MPSGWKHEPLRHDLARQGISTNIDRSQTRTPVRDLEYNPEFEEYRELHQKIADAKTPLDLNDVNYEVDRANEMNIITPRDYKQLQSDLEIRLAEMTGELTTEEVQ